MISIHASREGCDTRRRPFSKITRYFNPRIPRGMRRNIEGIICVIHPFQSTHPARDATYIHETGQTNCRFQSTHPARDATNICSTGATAQPISIHASREGCDPTSYCQRQNQRHFNPRIPRGMRLRFQYSDWKLKMISIHASREGCDVLDCLTSSIVSYFNPRIPRGMRPPTLFISLPKLVFQSTHPARDATLGSTQVRQTAPFQSTHPARDATSRSRRTGTGSGYFNPRIPRGMRRLPTPLYGFIRSDFNPRIPRGMRQSRQKAPVIPTGISIHASREGCDYTNVGYQAGRVISIHASREGCDSTDEINKQDNKYFNPRIPRGMRLVSVCLILQVFYISIHASREGCDTV